MRLRLLLVLFYLPWSVLSQDPCPFYTKYLEEGDKARDEKKFEEAIKKYNIALLHCPERADTAQTRILSAFKAINALKEEADHQKRLSQENWADAELKRLVLQTELVENYPEKVSLALRAYYLNKAYHNNEWNSTIVNAFWLSDPGSYGEILIADSSAILDVAYVSEKIVALTEYGQLVEADTSGKKITRQKIEPIEEEHQYSQRNSLSFNQLSAQLELQDQNGNLISFKRTDTGWEQQPGFGAASPSNQIMINGKSLILDQNGVLDEQRKRIFEFEPNQTSTAIDIYQNTLLALGTQDGRIYFHNPEHENSLYNKPYHETGTRISDIAFDPNGEFIGTTGMDGQVTLSQIKDLGGNTPAHIMHSGWVNCIEFLPNKRFIVGTQSGKVILYRYNQDVLSKYACESRHLPEIRPSIDQEKADSLMISECPKISNAR